MWSGSSWKTRRLSPSVLAIDRRYLAPARAVSRNSRRPRFPIERGQKIRDARGAVGEIRHQAREFRIHRPFEAVALGPPLFKEPKAGLFRQVEPGPLPRFPVRVDKEEPCAGAAGNDVGRRAPLDALSRGPRRRTETF